MIKLFIFHALDKTTEFLNIFQDNFPDNFYTIVPLQESIDENIKLIKDTPENSTIIFLGHGHSTGLYSPVSDDFEKKIFVNVSLGNEIFINKDVILLSCNSNQYIRKISTYKRIIGFGNIISSQAEVSAEAEFTGKFRKLDETDISYFNLSYSKAIIHSLKYFMNNGDFNVVPKIIEYYINKSINETLLNKELNSRVEVSKLLFEFRNEMLVLKHA